MIAFINNFFPELKKNNIDFLILRNYEGLPNKISGRDLDFIVERKNKEKILQIINNLRENYNLKILQIVCKYHLLTVRIAKFDNKIISLTLDFFFYIGWQGAEFLSAREILKNYRKYEGFKIPSKLYEPLITILHHYLWTGYLKKEKYKTQILDLFNDKNLSEELYGILLKVFNKKDIKKIYNSFNDDFGRIPFRYKWLFRFKLINSNIKNNFIRFIIRSFIIIKRELFYSFKPDGKVFIINYEDRDYFLNNEFKEMIKAIDGKNHVVESQTKNRIFFFFNYITNYYFFIRRHSFIFIILSSQIFLNSFWIKLNFLRIYKIEKGDNIYLALFNRMVKNE